MNKLIEFAQKRPLVATGALFVILAIAWIGIAWILAPSTVKVPKAEQYEQQAQQHEVNANIAETQANTIRESRTRASQATATSKNKLKEKKQTYEEVRKAPVNNSNTDLDARERKLQSDLTKLYPN